MAKSRNKPFQFDPAMRVILLKGSEPYLQSQYLRLISEGIEAQIGEPPSRFDFDGPSNSSGRKRIGGHSRPMRPTRWKRRPSSFEHSVIGGLPSSKR